jgi:spermidine synthase
MTLGWASQTPALRQQSIEVLTRRFEDAAIETRYYTPAVHGGAFALPRFVEEAIGL